MTPTTSSTSTTCRARSRSNTPAGGDPTITGAPLLSATLTVKDLGSNFLGCDTAGNQ